MSAPLKRHFLTHQIFWPCILLAGWALLNIALLTTTELMEFSREGRRIPIWEPLSWEVTSVAMILVCVWPLAYVIRFLQSRYGLWQQLLWHLVGMVVFSLVHVGGMVALRKIWYQLAGSEYVFGHIGYEFLYEFRKDAMSYLMLVVVIGGYQFIVRRLQGEASYVSESEESSQPLTDRLLVKKLGKEFLITVADIEWIEASGNYANLHLAGKVYPMRITMAKMQQQLPAAQFRRVHRSAIVNIQAIDHLEPTEFGDYLITLKGGAKVGLSRRYRDDFKTFMSGAGKVY